MKTSLLLIIVVSLTSYLVSVNSVSTEGHTLVIEEPNYSYFCTGNCKKDVTTNTTSGWVLMGGGDDVDAAFVWAIERSGYGDFLVIRTVGTDAYDPYIYKLGKGKLNSAATLIIKNKAGTSEQFVLTTLENCEALFVAGGDQYDYYSQWKGTPAQTALNNLINVKKIPFGGTSAGQMVQGQFIYTAQADSVTSPQALNNPYNKDITLGSDLFNTSLLQNVILDAHFIVRDRMGRLITFLARLLQDGTTDVIRGIGVDEGAALLVDENGNADYVAWENTNNAYFLTTNNQKPLHCKAGDPLTYKNISIFRISGNQSNVFDFSTWTPNLSIGTSYYISANSGKLSSTQKNGKIY